MDPYKVRAFIEQFSETHLQEALKAFMDIDGKLKGGSAGKPPMLLDRLVLQLCDRPKPDARKSAAMPSAPAAAPRTRSLSNVRTVSVKRPGS
jgi:hypothetical protein